MGNDNLNGGSGIDTIDYTDAAGIINVNLGSNTATGEGTDTLSSIENVIGSNNADTVTGSSANNDIDGGNGFDTFSFANASGAINLNLSTNTSTGYGSDTFTSVERFQMSNHNDTITGGGRR